MITAREGALLAGGAIVLGSGIWLTSTGRPYGTPLLTVHKLVDLVAIVAIVYFVYRAASASGPSPSMPVLILAAVVALVAFGTGGVLSAMESAPPAALWAHRIAGLVLPVIAGYLLFLVRASH